MINRLTIPAVSSVQISGRISVHLTIEDTLPSAAGAYAVLES